MTPTQRRRRALTAGGAVILAPALWPHLATGDGLWLLTLASATAWTAWAGRRLGAW